MAKQDLLDEAEALGIEGLDESNTNRQIQAAIDEALEAVEAPESFEVAVEEQEDPAPVEVAVEAPEASEPTFALEQLMEHSEAIFGVGRQVLVGARSAGKIPSGPVTKEVARNGIDQYLNMPVEQG